jgi:diaminopimelate decarboxylase
MSAVDHFAYKRGELYCEDVSVADVAGAAGTPCYVYSRATLRDHYRRLAEAFAPLEPLICYAIKSCSNLSVCRTLAECGAGMDLVSGGELHRARLAGVDPGRCVYAGVGKTDDEIYEALSAGVAALRVNPDVDPHTHRYTTTGKKETKFGVDLERARVFFDTYGRDEHCALAGIHLHLGSPIYSAAPYVRSTRKVLRLIEELEQRGHRVEMLDIGGGFGADYETEQTPPAAQYAAEIVPLLEARARSGLRIIIEPGVLYVKQSGAKTFVICDGGMNTLLRPSHYGAFHFIWPCRVADRHLPDRRAREMDLPGLQPADVVGPICETGDFLAEDRLLPPVTRGDLLAVFSPRSWWTPGPRPSSGAANGMMISRRTSPNPSRCWCRHDQTRRRRRLDNPPRDDRGASRRGLCVPDDAGGSEPVVPGGGESGPQGRRRDRPGLERGLLEKNDHRHPRLRRRRPHRVELACRSVRVPGAGALAGRARTWRASWPWPTRRRAGGGSCATCGPCSRPPLTCASTGPSELYRTKWAMTCVTRNA